MIDENQLDTIQETVDWMFPTVRVGDCLLINGDCADVLACMDAGAISSVVTDPPYGLSKEPDMHEVLENWITGRDYEHKGAGFMGKTRDSFVPGPALWSEIVRTLKPGGHLVAFAGSRTYDLMAVAIRLAEMEIRDQIMWLYGCLDDQTKAVTPSGLKDHSELASGDMVLSYDAENKTYQWDEIEHVHRYDIADTVYRISTDYGDQVVSRNHRCIVERGGDEVFEVAEVVARERETRVPVLENLSDLLNHLFVPHAGASGEEHDLFESVQGCENRTVECWGASDRNTQRQVKGSLRGVSDAVLAKYEVGSPSGASRVLAELQRGSAGCEVDSARAQGAPELAAGSRGRIDRPHDRTDQSRVERRSDVPEATRELREREVRSVSSTICDDVAQGRIRDAPSVGCRSRDRPVSDSDGMRTPYRSRPDEQLCDELDVVPNEQRSQTVRAWRGHSSAVGRITPEHYAGTVWCVKVRTGAFVASRNGFAFPTGNSGFPKSHNISKAIDKAAGVEVPGTDAAKQWDGWGTALKPAHEPVVLARKPFAGTVAENVLEHGTGAINVDGCRIEARGRPAREATPKDHLPRNVLGGNGGSKAVGVTDQGRFPANIMHDGSGEVLAEFPVTKSGSGNKNVRNRDDRNAYGKGLGAGNGLGTGGDSGSAARFFYSAKPSKAERDFGLDTLDEQQWHQFQTGGGASGSPSSISADRNTRRKNVHPTVKPIAVMSYLIRLITPPGGVVLDPFMGSGTTGMAACLEGMPFIGIERDPEYFAIACARIRAAATDTETLAKRVNGKDSK